MAGGASVEGLGQDRQPRRHAENVELVASLLDDGFGAARSGRRQENSVGRAGNIFFRAEDSDVGLDLIVVRRDFFVGDRPVVAHAVVGANLEIYRSEAQGDASPVIGAAANDARAEPAELRSGSGVVGLAFDFPRAVGRKEFVSDTLADTASDASAAMGQFVGPDVLLVIVLGIHGRAGLQQCDTQAAFSQHFGGSASGSARTDDADVISLGRARTCMDLPRSLSSKRTAATEAAAGFTTTIYGSAVFRDIRNSG